MTEDAKARDGGTTREPAAGNTYQLVLKGAGVAIERSIPEAVALSVISIVMGGQGARGLGTATAGPRAPGLAVGEYLASVNAKRQPEKILALGAFLTDEMNRETFTREEVRSMFQRAAEPVPGNFHRDFAWGIANRWLGEQAGAPGAFYVTRTGRQALDAKFGEAVKSGTKAPRRRRGRRSTTATSADDE